jgi:hypothetical protein
MATTTNYGWTTPDDTDLVKDGAAAIRTLGSSVDTTTKALNPETTEGDIAYRSATANTNTRLALGTAGQVLTVNSGEDAPEWATPATPAAAALVLTGSADFTTSSAVNINDCFSATYLNYLVMINLTAVSATDADLSARMRVSGTDASGANYVNNTLGVNGATVGGFRQTAQTSMNFWNIASSKQAQLATQATFFDPFVATTTKVLVHQNTWNSSDNAMRVNANEHQVSTSYDGVSFITSTGTISGKIRIYGYALS